MTSREEYASDCNVASEKLRGDLHEMSKSKTNIRSLAPTR